MQTLRTYANLAEAGFASSLLEAAEIRATLADEQSYTLGYGPVVGGIRLQVAEEDVSRAEAVLREGPSAVDHAAPPFARDAGPPPPGTGKFPAGIFLAALGMLGLVFFAVHQMNEKERSGVWESSQKTYDFDDNEDGRPDRYWTYRGEVAVKSESDLNRDGKIDAWEYFDRKGRIERGEADANFDGKIDIWWSYRQGVPVTMRRDLDFNGVPDETTIFEHGQTHQIDVAPNGSDKVLSRELYQHGVLREKLADSDGDGRFDNRIKYDAFGRGGVRVLIDAPK